MKGIYQTRYKRNMTSHNGYYYNSSHVSNVVVGNSEGYSDTIYYGRVLYRSLYISNDLESYTVSYMFSKKLYNNKTYYI